MSKSDSPMAGMTQMQRRSLEQSRRFFHLGIENQRAMLDLFAGGLEAGESMQRKSADTMRNGMESMVRSMESTIPGGRGAFGPFVEAMDRQFDLSDEAIENAWESYEGSVEDGVEAFESFLEQYGESVDDSFDRYLDLLDDVEPSTQ